MMRNLLSCSFPEDTSAEVQTTCFEIVRAVAGAELQCLFGPSVTLSKIQKRFTMDWCAKEATIFGASVSVNCEKTAGWFGCMTHDDSTHGKYAVDAKTLIHTGDTDLLQIGHDLKAMYAVQTSMSKADVEFRFKKKFVVKAPSRENKLFICLPDSQEVCGNICKCLGRNCKHWMIGSNVLRKIRLVHSEDSDDDAFATGIEDKSPSPHAVIVVLGPLCDFVEFSQTSKLPTMHLLFQTINKLMRKLLRICGVRTNFEASHNALGIAKDF